MQLVYTKGIRHIDPWEGQMKEEKNFLKKVRIEKMLSKAELSRRAGLSVLTIDRIERGASCRHITKRKILQALGIEIADREKVFPIQNTEQPTEIQNHATV